MTEDKVTPITKGRSKKKTPTPPIPNLTDVEQYSGLRMSDYHIALLLKIPFKDFQYLEQNCEPFAEALERGRAMACVQAAMIFMKAMKGQLVDQQGNFTDKEREQLRAAEGYLKKHSPEWLRDRGD